MNRYLSIAALSLAVSSSVVFAEGESQKESQLNEVIVTASLMPVQLHQSGNAISVISAEDIENSRAAIVSDLLRNVPSLAISRNGVLGSSTQLRMRGAEGNHVLVMIDGVEVNDAAQADEFNWAHLSSENIEKIEVIRGPQSSLWGSDAVSGVVNIITKKADTPFQGSLFTEAGSFGTQNSGFALGSRGDNYHINLSGSQISSEGENISRQGDEEDGYKNSTLNLTAGWEVLDNWSLSFTGRQTEGENEFDNAPFAFPVDSDHETEFRQRFARLQTDISLLDNHWQQRLAVSISRHDNENFADGSFTGSGATRKKQYSYLNSFNWAEQSQRLSLLLEHETEDYSQRGIVQPWGDPNQNRSRKNDSAALEYRLTLWDDLSLAASTRRDNNSEFDDSDTYQLQASYLLPDSGTRLRASYGTAVKNPTFSERYGFFTNFQGNPDLEPEESTSWEIGVDQTLMGGDLQLGLTYFKAKLENEINGFVFDFDTFAFTAENVDGESHREGIEATVNAQLSSSLFVSASYTYTDSTEESSATGDDVDELRRARHLASANLSWAATEDLRFVLNAQYNGEQKDADFNFFPAEIVTLDDYTLLNFTANYQVTEKLALYTRLENILDEDYEEVLGYQALGFGGHIGVRYDFSK